MKTTNLKVAVVGAAACAMLLANRVEAATGIISVNIHEFSGLVNQIDGEETFGIPAEGSVAGNWHNFQGGLGPLASVTDLALSDGRASTVDITPSNNPAGTRTFDFSGAQDNTPWRSGQMIYPAGVENPPFIDLAGLSGTFSSYKIIAYLTGFNAAAGGNQGLVELANPSDGNSLSDQYYWQVANPYSAALRRRPIPYRVTESRWPTTPCSRIVPKTRSPFSGTPTMQALPWADSRLSASSCCRPSTLISMAICMSTELINLSGSAVSD